MPESGRQVAMVTGASRGLGLLLARELGRRGFDLVVCARSSDGIDGAAAELRGTGAEVIALSADVSVRAEVEGLISAAMDRFGRLDVLVNNAGTIQVGPVTTMGPDQFADAMGAMFWGPVYTSLAVLPVMRQRGSGRIINITSIGGKLPAPHLLPYTSAKYAATGFSEGMRVELAKHGISVTTVVPGLMRTGSPRNALFTGDRRREYQWFALGDSIPLVSMDAERAAHKIIDAGLRGRAELVLTPAAKLAVLAHGVAPGLVSHVAALADQLLPSGEQDGRPTPGHAAAGTPPRWFELATRLTRTAAGRFRQFDDPTTARDFR